MRSTHDCPRCQNPGIPELVHTCGQALIEAPKDPNQSGDERVSKLQERIVIATRNLTAMHRLAVIGIDGRPHPGGRPVSLRDVEKMLIAMGRLTAAAVIDEMAICDVCAAQIRKLFPEVP
jgi:hypothetical protein